MVQSITGHKKNVKEEDKDWRRFSSRHGKIKMIIERIEDEHFVMESNCGCSLN